MGFINSNGENISFECSELIEELKEDIAEFGGDLTVAVWCKNLHGVTVYTNYDFITDDDPINKSELQDGEFIQPMSMSALLTLLEKQNEII